MTTPALSRSPSRRCASSLVLSVSGRRRISNTRQAPPTPPRKAAVMAIEESLILCKPDAVARGLVGEIVARFERRGYVIAAMKLLLCDKARAERHYAEHLGKPFYDGLVSYITSAP